MYRHWSVSESFEDNHQQVSYQQFFFYVQLYGNVQIPADLWITCSLSREICADVQRTKVTKIKRENSMSHLSDGFNLYFSLLKCMKNI